MPKTKTLDSNCNRSNNNGNTQRAKAVFTDSKYFLLVLVNLDKKALSISITFA